MVGANCEGAGLGGSDQDVAGQGVHGVCGGTGDLVGAQRAGCGVWERAEGGAWGAAGGCAGASPFAAPRDSSLAAPPAGGAAAAGGATDGWVEVGRCGRRRRRAQAAPSPSPVSGDRPGGEATTTAVRAGLAVRAGRAAVRAVSALPRSAAGARVGGVTPRGLADGGGGVVGERDAATAPPRPTRLGPGGAPLLPSAAATAADRAAAAAAELGRVRRHAANAPTLATIYVAGVSRDVRQHRLRGLLADVTGVHAHAVVDADRFGATTAVTVVPAEADAFRAAVGRGRAATVLRLLPDADPWAPALLGVARRRGVGAVAAAEAAVAFCLRRFKAKLAQLPASAAMPPHLRAALHAHIQGMLASHAGGEGGHRRAAGRHATAGAVPQPAHAPPRWCRPAAAGGRDDGADGHCHACPHLGRCRGAHPGGCSRGGGGRAAQR